MSEGVRDYVSGRFLMGDIIGRSSEFVKGCNKGPMCMCVCVCEYVSMCE